MITLIRINCVLNIRATHMAPDLVALVAVVVWLAAISNAEPTTTTKPHIIVIMADDLVRGSSHVVRRAQIAR